MVNQGFYWVINGELNIILFFVLLINFSSLYAFTNFLFTLEKTITPYRYGNPFR